MLFACCHLFCSAIYTDDSILVRINASHFAGGGGLHTNHQCILIWIWKPTKASDVAMNAGSSPNLMERPKGELMSWWRGHSFGRQITLSPWLNTRFQIHTSLFWKKQTHWCENICPCTVTELMPDSEIHAHKNTRSLPLFTWLRLPVVANSYTFLFGTETLEPLCSLRSNWTEIFALICQSDSHLVQPGTFCHEYWP